MVPLQVSGCGEEVGEGGEGREGGDGGGRIWYRCR